jgi:Flp pilus assembly protein TadD
MRRRPESLPHFEKAVAIGPATRGRLLDLGVAYSDVSRFEEAEAAYTRLLALSPGDPDAYLNLANNAVRRGQFDRGIELFGRAIAVSPDFLFAHYHLGHTLKFLGRRAPAEAEYQKVLGLPAKTPREAMARVDALYQIGSMDLAGGDAARAEGRFAEVIRVAPDHIAAHWGRAQALLRLGRNEEARAEIETHSRLLARRMPSGPAASAH